MSSYEVTIEVTVRVNLNGVAGERSVDRYVENEDGIQDYLYGPMTREQVLTHLAYNGACNSVSDASRIDGWADLNEDVVTMWVVGAERDPLYPIEAAS